MLKQLPTDSETHWLKWENILLENLATNSESMNPELSRFFFLKWVASFDLSKTVVNIEASDNRKSDILDLTLCLFESFDQDIYFIQDL